MQRMDPNPMGVSAVYGITFLNSVFTVFEAAKDKDPRLGFAISSSVK